MTTKGENPEEDLYEHYFIKADAGQELLRIDKFLMDRLANVSRNKLKGGIKEGFVKVNGENVKPNYKVHPKDEVRVMFPTPPRDKEVIPEDVPLNIVLEDEYLLVVNKPPGMVVHPAYQNWSGTLVNALAYHFEKLPEMDGNEGRPGLIHRIDKDTSGLLVIAKTKQAMKGLAKQFFDHSIERTYHALIWGVPEKQYGIIDVNVGRSFKDRRVTTAFPKGDYGKHAVTHYEILEDLRYVSLLKCHLKTGRTHQIRAHMHYMKHPLFNDAVYGGHDIVKGTVFTKYKQFVKNCFKQMPRQALHAKTLGFIHPVTGENVFVDSPLPHDFSSVLEKWRGYIKP